MADLKSQNSARPSSLGSPVPGEDNAKLAADFAANFKPQAADPNAQAAAAFAAQQAPPAQAAAQPGLLAQAESAGAGALDAAGRGLDYLAGGVRTGVAGLVGAGQNAVEAATGQPLSAPLVSPEDIKNTAKGKAPNSAEYLRRLGVSEGGSLNLPGIGKTTLRGAEGLALDIGLDPLVAISKLIKEAPYIGKVINAPGKGMEALGEAVYKSAIPDTAKDAGDLLLHGAPEAGIAANAPIGGAEKIAQKASDMAQTLGKVRQGLYDKAAQMDAYIPMKDIFTRSEAMLSKIESNPNLKPLAADLRETINNYKNTAGVTLEQASDWKTQLYDSLPAKAFDGFGKLKNVSQAFKGALAADLRQAIVNVGNKAEKGLGDSVNAINEKWGILLDAAKPLDKAADKTGVSFGKGLDSTVLAAGGFKALALKKAAELATTSTARTAIGKALMEAGRAGVANRAIIDVNQQINPTPTKP